MFVGVRDPFVISLAVFILIGVRVGVAAMPEFAYELLAFLVSLQLIPRLQLFGGDNRLNVNDPSFERVVRLGFDPAWFVLHVGCGSLRKGRRNYERNCEQDRDPKCMNEHDDATPSERWADAVIDKRGDSTTHKQNRLSNPGNREPILRRIVYGKTVNFAVCTSDCPLTRSRTRTSIE